MEKQGPEWSSLALCHVGEDLELESLLDATNICFFATKLCKPTLPYLKYFSGGRAELGDYGGVRHSPFGGQFHF